MIVWQRHNGVTEQGEIPYAVEQDEPITFNSREELDLYILDLLSKIIYGDEEDGR